MRRLFFSFLFSLTSLLLTFAGQRQLMDSGWRFFLGDAPEARTVAFDDRSWIPIDLPHDWSISGVFNKDETAGNDGGYLPTGTGWYRKSFIVPKKSAGKILRLYFEGVYMNSEVYVNGQLVGGHPYGYTSFFCDITQSVRYGQRNIISVRVDNSQQKNCRWYSGSGIYRHVWLLTSDRVHFEGWGIYVRTSRQDNGWTLSVDAPFRDEGLEQVTPEIRHTLYAPDGQVAATSTGPQTSQTMTIAHPSLWSPEQPSLYRLRSQLVVGGKVVDEVMTTTGFRTLEYDSDRGFRLNGKPVILNGGCVHHDNGLLGAAAFDAAEVRKVELMKAGGFNAVRTSHNPPSEAFLHACDSLGLLVIDEVFDGWRQQKNEHDYHGLFDDWWEKDVTAMVLRDRNHPSIFCWSTGNEVMERKQIEVVTTAHKLSALCHRLDPTRPVTSALCAWDKDWEIYDPLSTEHDITGYNYMIHKAESDHHRVPARVMVQTESYPRDAYQNWLRMQDKAYIIGDFVWTAIDYLGESGIGRYYYTGDVPGEHYHRPLFPWHAAYCGDIDLTGQRKPISHLRSMLYNARGEQLYLAVREPNGYTGEVQETQWGTWPTWESWTWPGWTGKDIDVEVCSRYPLVRLYLNDQLVGEKKPEQFIATFTLPYQAGTLRAEGISNGQVMEQRQLMTAGAPARIRLSANKSVMQAGGQDLVYVTAEVVDDQGNICPNDSTLLTFSIQGNATLLAVGNADIKSLEPYWGSTHHAWKGRALAILRSGKKPGTVTLTVEGDGLQKGTVKMVLKGS